MMQAFCSYIDNGFMADDDLKNNMVEINTGNQDRNTNDSNVTLGEKSKVCESSFSVERLLATNDKDRRNTETKEEELADPKPYEGKKNQFEDQENLNVCEFESLSNEYQTSKMQLFDNLEEQIPVSKSEGLVKDDLGISNNETGDLKFCKNNIGNDIVNMKYIDANVENSSEEFRNLNTYNKLNYSSDDSEYNGTFDSKLDEDDKSSKENLMRFAEVLYKCTLCTSIPSILTSKESFVKHITEQHLTHQQNFVDCSQCLLKFQTDEDLKEHKQLTHNARNDATVSELHDYAESDILSYDLDTLDRDDSDSHSSGHRNSTFVFTQSDENKNVSNVNFGKNVKTTDGSLDLSLKNGHNIKRTLKPVKIKERDPNQNLPLLHQITDQIVKSSTFSKNKFETQRPVEFAPSHTPEFGKYTKLVREGGNIVYFCQVCNWKSPVKATFSVHCGIADHKRKVIMAERSEKGNSCELDLSKISALQTSESDCLKKTQDVKSVSKSVPFSGEPVGWKPRGGATCMSLLSEPSGFYIGSKAGPIKNRSELNKALSDKVHSNYRRKKMMNSVRHQMRLKPKWSDTDSDDNDDDFDKSLLPINGHAHNNNLAMNSLNLSPNHMRKVTDTVCDDRRKENNIDHKDEMLVIKNEISDTEMHVVTEQSEPTEKKPKLSPHAETSVQTLIDKHVIENIKHRSEAVFKLYKCHICSYEYSDLKEYEIHFEEVHKSHSSPDLDIEAIARKHGDRSNTGTPNAEGTCNEHWRVQKIKEYLPDFVKVSMKGIASRDTLLQRISTASGAADLVGCTSACNKAMREMFPGSLAQRKGKYKKTFYFGVSLIDDSNQDEEITVGSMVGDPDSFLYQPIRDLNADIEKLLEHLPTILLWTGDMEKGVYRDDILQALADMTGDPETKNWGKQCNKAVRIVFPNVEIKRKGKDKTSVYFGLDFYNFTDTQPNVFGRPKKIDLDLSNNSSPVSKISPDTEKPLNLASAWTSLTDHNNHYKADRDTKGSNSDKQASELKEKHSSENNFQVEEYLTKFGGVSMFDSNEEDNGDIDGGESDKDYMEMSVTKEETKGS